MSSKLTKKPRDSAQVQHQQDDAANYGPQSTQDHHDQPGQVASTAVGSGGITAPTIETPAHIHEVDICPKNERDTQQDEHTRPPDSISQSLVTARDKRKVDGKPQEEGHSQQEDDSSATARGHSSVTVSAQMSASNAKYPLRLEWVEAGSLAENPLNWRKHSEEQLQSIRELLADPDVGWAGACLFNERTSRLVDGHARKQVVDPKTPVPVLIGNWSPEAEAKILATLDPVGQMATGDSETYAKLIEQINANGLWVRDLLHNTAADLNARGLLGDDDKPEDDTPSHKYPEMECQPFEHHDYIMLMFHNDQDFQQACELLGIQKVQINYPGGLQKVGLGRCIDGARAIERLRFEGKGRPQ